MLIVAEIGNNHLGNLNRLKMMILRAKECGADMVKSQAFNPAFVTGSMDKSFYEKCALSKEQYEEIIEFANNINVPFFYSVFHTELEYLEDKCGWKKISGSQYLHVEESKQDVRLLDNINNIISVPYSSMIEGMKYANILHVTEYLTDKPNIHKIDLLKQYNSHVGYSDHTIGIDNCVKAAKEFGAEMIEKHFVLGEMKNNIYHNGKLFRDSVHAADEKELGELSRALK